MRLVRHRVSVRICVFLRFSVNARFMDRDRFGFRLGKRIMVWIIDGLVRSWYKVSDSTI